MRRSDKLHVLIAGGGVAALEAMVALTKLAGELVDVELLSPDTDFFYRPLSVAEPFGLGDVLRFDLADACAGLRGRHSLAASWPSRRRIGASGRAATHPLRRPSIAIGARPREAVPGALTFGARRTSGS